MQPEPSSRVDVTVKRRVASAAVLLILAACPSSDESAPHTTAAMTPYGTAMADIARRFELLGRAATAKRYELAEYELREIAEEFEDALPHAVQPREGHPEVLRALQSTFVQTYVADVARALATHEQTKIATAFARMAGACNGCHQASGHGFINVPPVADRSVPNTDPLP